MAFLLSLQGDGYCIGIIHNYRRCSSGGKQDQKTIIEEDDYVSKAKLSELKIVEAGSGNSYFGLVKENQDGTKEVEYAVECEGSRDATIRKWLRRNIRGNFETVTLAGAVAYTIKELTPDEKIELEHKYALAERGEETAVPEMAVERFNKLIK